MHNSITPVYIRTVAIIILFMWDEDQVPKSFDRSSCISQSFRVTRITRQKRATNVLKYALGVLAVDPLGWSRALPPMLKKL